MGTSQAIINTLRKVSLNHPVSDSPTEFDRQMIQRCLALAQKAQGRTAPNPMVGAVVVQDGQIIGEGFHPGAGQPHAEVFALREAGDRAKNATIYVSLEPCSHHGRTPPCSEAVIRAGVARVVVGMVDPNPLVDGGGIAQLRAAGIEVLTGVESAACEELNEAFIYRMRHQQPLGILKYAMTIDGKIATSTGHSAWVSSPESRDYVHQLRSTCDAIVTGGNTVRRDDPLLTSHHAGAPNPLRVVLTNSLDLPQTAQLWDLESAQTLVVTKTDANPELQAWLRGRGVEVLTFDRPSPKLLMAHLFDRGCLSVLWECGGTLSAAAIADEAIQKVLAFIAPKLVGGPFSPGPVGDLGIGLMTEALALERVSWRSMPGRTAGAQGGDMLMQGYLPTKHPLNK
jgi:diaminohydroxyphosphoribosylaminopyrimidine deaminase / 5-amino-6-(5-phosphoribosylamino)uracil reductase